MRVCSVRHPSIPVSVLRAMVPAVWVSRRGRRVSGPSWVSELRCACMRASARASPAHSRLRQRSPGPLFHSSSNYSFAFVCLFSLSLCFCCCSPRSRSQLRRGSHLPTGTGQDGRTDGLRRRTVPGRQRDLPGKETHARICTCMHASRTHGANVCRWSLTGFLFCSSFFLSFRVFF